jgi:membrane fusion protein (multidrug efflux system)
MDRNTRGAFRAWAAVLYFELHGRVERIAPASGSQFALLPPDNATGNFTKVVQRIPVRIALDKGQPLLERLLPGMSVVTRIHTDAAAAHGGN